MRGSNGYTAIDRAKLLSFNAEAIGALREARNREDGSEVATTMRHALKDAGVAPGAVDYIIKPFDSERLLKKIETINLRQNTLYRILETTARLQADYLRTGDETDLRPVSLRMLARRLDLAPSTVSRRQHPAGAVP